MAQVAGVTWDQLSKGARETLGWARAAEVDSVEVGTRGLLIGMLRSGEDPANALLRHFGLDQNAAFTALQRQNPGHRLTNRSSATALTELPPLTANAAACITHAATLQREAELPSIDVGCLLAALLLVPRATARAALAELIPDEPIDVIAEATLAWLRGNNLTYPRTLQQRFPRPRGSTTEETATASARDPWPYLAVLRRHVSIDGPSDMRNVGLGFLRSADTLVTASRAAGVSDALVFVPESDSEHEFEFGPSDPRETMITVLGLSPPAAWRAIRAFPPIVAATAGQRCFVATVDDHFPDIALQEGVVANLAEDVNGGALLTVELNVPLSGNRTAMGSPVVSADGEIIGLVSPSATNRSVDAWGHAAILSVLGRDPAEPPLAVPPPATGTLSGAGNDAVGDIDQLGFQTYVNAFADLIISQHTQPPLTIGIFGSWGMGKSFLLTHIEREIDRRQEENPHTVPKVHVVRFNAWEYSSMDVVWPALVRTIVSRLDKLSTWPWHRRLWTRVRWNLARQWRQLWPRLVAGAIVVGALIVAAVMSGEDNVAKAIGGVAAALGVAGVLKAAKDPVANWVTTLFADSDYGDQLRVMTDIKHDLTSLEERLHATNAAGEDIVTGRILILIDDLDRCEPGKAVEVLQALNLLLNFNSFVVVLGIDARIVTGAIEKHYEGLLGKAGASGYEYLDKIVQIPFRIPEPAREEIITFVAGQLGNPAAPEPPPPKELDGGARPDATGLNASELDTTDEPEAQEAPDEQDVASQPRDLEQERIRRARERLSELERLIPPPAEVPFTYDEQQAFALFADQLRPNPRHLKRLVNVYRLVRALAKAQDEPLILARPAATIRWLVMWSQWPYTSLRMVDRYEELFDQHGPAIAEHVTVDEPMLHLLDHVEPGLDPDMRNRLDDQPDELRRLLSIAGCGFSWEEIRRIRPYTVNFNPAVEEQVRRPATPSA